MISSFLTCIEAVLPKSRRLMSRQIINYTTGRNAGIASVGAARNILLVITAIKDNSCWMAPCRIDQNTYKNTPYTY